jgi:hypothetical protein
MTQRSIVAAGLGAASPSLLRLAIGLEAGQGLPEGTYVIGLVIFVLLGSIVGWLFDERDLKRAFYMGIGLPALLQLGISELDRPPALAPSDPAASAAAPGDSVSGVALEIAALDDLRHLVDVAWGGPQRLVLLVASGQPHNVQVEFSDPVGARVVRGPASETDRLLEFDVPEGATSFRVVVGRSYAAPQSLGAAGAMRYRVAVSPKRWSGLKQAIGADSAPAYVVRVEPLGRSVGRT